MPTRESVIQDVTAFVAERYNGDWKKAFDAEDSDHDGRLSSTEVSVILAKAGVGMRLTRWAIALEVISAMDVNGNGYINWDEFSKLSGV